LIVFERQHIARSVCALRSAKGKFDAQLDDTYAELVGCVVQSQSPEILREK